MTQRRTLSSLAALFGLSACVATTPAPDPIRPNDVGRYLSGPTGHDRLIAACGDDPVAEDVRDGMRDWVDVVAHTDSCDLPQIRYQLRQRGAYTRGLGELTRVADSCGGEARRLERRIDAWTAELGRAAEQGVVVCGAEKINADAVRLAEIAHARAINWRRRVAAQFPELGR